MGLEIVVATRNRKKVEEISRILAGMPVVLFTLDDFPGMPEVVEDADTFEGNAVKKAQAVARHTGRAAVSDDSGLEVDALHGAPGIFSARYAGPEANDRKNVEKLLSEIKGVEQAKRSARFVCCIALAFPDGSVETFTGYAEGKIGSKQRGENGFGYDPVFCPAGHHRTFAEMTALEKDMLSHRGQALEKLRKYLYSQVHLWQ